MNRNFHSFIITAAAMLLGSMTAVAAESSNVYFGYAPSNPEMEMTSAQGSGKNNYLEAMIRLSPSEMPAVEALKGGKVVGVRCYLREDYRNPTGKKYSCISYYDGSLTATPVRQVVHFTKGWNEFMFDTPVTIGDADIYVGYQVFEIQGTPYPAVSFKTVSVPDGYYMDLGRQGFSSFPDKGTLLVEAIIEPSGETPASGALAMTVDHPLVVAPNAPFECGLYLRNLTATPISKATVTVTDSEGTVTDNVDLTFAEPIAAYDGRVIDSSQVVTGSDEGNSVPLTFTVTSINGDDAAVTHPITEQFYVTRDAFNRVPLVEEFTSMACVNCPFMFYYLDEAMELFGHPHVYVTHHSGFSYDAFTQPVDKEMEYMFNGYQRNPAMMFDRTILSGQSELVLSAFPEASSEKYLACLELARHTPAMASVDVVADNAAKTVTVSGRVSLGDKTSDGNVFISAYYVEDGISTELFPQMGINTDMADDAPADLKEKYKHNGVIRANLCANAMGDPLEFDADGNYSVTFPMSENVKVLNADKCHYVAFVHRNNKDDLRDNIVLNAGDSRPWNPAAISEVKADASGALKVFVGSDSRIYVVSPVTSVAVFDMNGRQLDSSAAQLPGVYVVRAILPDGSAAATKVAVR